MATTPAPSQVYKWPNGQNYALVAFDNWNKDKIYLYSYSQQAYLPVLNVATLSALNRGAGLTGSSTLPVNHLDSSVLSSPDDAWHGDFLDNTYAVRTDGTIPDLPASVASRNRGTQSDNPIDAATGKIYGQDRHDAAYDSKVATSLTNFFSYLETNPTTSDGQLRVDPTWLKSQLYTSDGKPTALFKSYFNAVSYGGYTVHDVFRDLQLLSRAATDPSYQGLRAVSGSQGRSDFMRTEDAAKVWNDATVYPDTELMGKFGGSDSLGGLAAIPEDYFTNNAYTAGAVSATPSDFDEARKLDASTFDAVNAIATARSEQEREAAKGMSEMTLKRYEATAGTALSNNVLAAWNQIQQIRSNAAQAGISGSGEELHQIEQTAISSALQNRKARESTESTKVQQEVQDALQNGSAEDVRALADRLDAEDKANGVAKSEYRSAKMGLRVPQSSIQGQYSMENLMKAYPGLTPEEITKYVVPTLYDANGNAVSASEQATRKATLDRYLGSLSSRQESADQQKILKQQQTASKLTTDFTDPGASGMKNLGKDNAPAANRVPDFATDTSKMSSVTPSAPSSSAAPSGYSKVANLSELQSYAKQGLSEANKGLVKVGSSYYAKPPATREGLASNLAQQPSQLVKVQKNGTTMTVDQKNLGTWTGSGWSKV